MNGLIIACLVAVLNSLADVSRKKVLDRGQDASLVVVWCKLVALTCYVVADSALLLRHVPPTLPPIGASLGFSPIAALSVFLFLDILFEGSAVALNYQALQVSPLSLCMPLTGLTPLFLLPAGALLLHESISTGMVVGVLLVTAGSLAINRPLLAQGWLGPVRGILREKGSRYMVFVALFLACSTLLDKWFLTQSDHVGWKIHASRSFTLATAKGTALLLFFLVLHRLRRNRSAKDRAASAESARRFEPTRVWREVPYWVLAAGILEALVLPLQFTAIQFAPVALVIAIKRSGILLDCAMGWFFFKERGIANRVIGAFIMLVGVTLFFLTKPDDAGRALIDPARAIGVALATAAAATVALWFTRRPSAPPMTQESR